MMSPAEADRDYRYDLENPEMRRELEAEMSRGGNSIQRAALEDFHTRMYGGGGGMAPTTKVGWVHENAPARLNTKVGWVHGPAPSNPDQNDNFLKDSITDVKRGIAKLPGAVGGLIDLPIAATTGYRPMARAGEFLADATGVHPDNWAEAQTRNYSPERQASQAAIDAVTQDPNATFMEKVGAHVGNPRAGIGGVVETVPSLLAGGAVTKGLQATAYGLRAAGAMGSWAPGVMGGVGQGAVSAGAQMAGVSPDAPDQERQAWAAMGRGATDAAFMAAGGKLANKLGLETPATAMAGGRVLTPIATHEAMDLLAAARPAALSRTQTMLDTAGRLSGASASQALQGYPLGYAGAMWQNYGAGKEDLTEGAESAGIGAAVGGAMMGPMFNLRRHTPTARELYDTAAERSARDNNVVPHEEFDAVQSTFEQGRASGRSNVYTDRINAQREELARRGMYGDTEADITTPEVTTAPPERPAPEPVAKPDPVEEMHKTADTHEATAVDLRAQSEAPAAAAKTAQQRLDALSKRASKKTRAELEAQRDEAQAAADKMLATATESERIATQIREHIGQEDGSNRTAEQVRADRLNPPKPTLDVDRSQDANRETIPAGDEQGAAEGSVGVDTQARDANGGKTAEAGRPSTGQDTQGKAAVSEDTGDTKTSSLEDLSAGTKTKPVKRKAFMGKEDEVVAKALMPAIKGDYDNPITKGLGGIRDTVVNHIEAIHNLTKRREALIDELGSSTKGDQRAKIEGADDELHIRLTENGNKLVSEMSKLEQLVGHANISKAQDYLKGPKSIGGSQAEGGNQSSESTRFSIHHSDWQLGYLAKDKPLHGTTSKDIRERRELGDFKESKLADAYIHGFTASGGYRGKTKLKYAGGAEAVLQYMMHGGVHNAFVRRLASVLNSAMKRAAANGIAPPTMEFYNENHKFGRGGERSLSETKTTPPTKLGLTEFANGRATIHIGMDGHSNEVVLHEILHAVVGGIIHAGKDTALVRGLDALRKEVLKTLKTKAFEDVRTALGDKAMADLADPKKGVHEFVSYGLTHEDFRSAMERMGASKNETVVSAMGNMLTKFVRQIRMMLGLPFAEEKALSQFINMSHTLIGSRPVAHATDAEFITAKAGMAMERQPELDGVFHAQAVSAPVNGVIQVPEVKYGEKYAPTKAIGERIFAAMLPGMYAGDRPTMQKMDAWAKKSYEGLEKFSPNLAAFVGWVSADVPVSEKMAKAVEVYKRERNAAVTAASKLGEWMAHVDQAEVIKAMDFMDAYAKDKGTATTDLHENVQHRIVAAHEAITNMIAASKPEVAQRFEGLLPSEMLTYALHAREIQGSALGAREGKLDRATVDIALSDDGGGKFVIAPMTPSGERSVRGRFYPTYASKSAAPKAVHRMVHESELAGFKPDASVGESVPNKLEQYRVKEAVAMPEGQGDGLRFRKVDTVQSVMADPKAKGRETDVVATSFLNTVSILSNAVATRKLVRDISSVGAKENRVFEDKEALLAHLQKSDPNKADVFISDMSDPDNSSAPMQWENRKPGNWVQAPKTDAYGDLAGKIVEGPVWSRLQDAVTRTAASDLRAYNSLLSTFKKMKTVYNPPTHVTNIMGNVTLAYLNNIPIASVKDALGLYIRYSTGMGKLSKDEHAIMAAFFHSGATVGDWATHEVKQIMYEGMAAQTESASPGMLATLRHWAGYESHLAEKIAALAAKKGKRADDFMQEVYGAGDNAFRLAAFMTEMARQQRDEAHLSKADMESNAGAAATHKFLNYDNDSRLLNLLRKGPLPFASWPFAMGGLLAHIAKHEPWKIASLAMGYAMVSGAFTAMNGGPDDEKKRARAHKDSKTWFGANKSWNVGKHNGNDVYFDAAKWFMPSPLEFSDAPNGFLGWNSMPSAVTPNNPFTTAMMYAFGYDPYLGKPLNKETDNTADKIGTRALRMAEQFTPPLVNHKTFESKPGLLGHGQDTAVVATRKLLAPVSAVDNAETAKSLELEINRTKRAFDQDISNAKRAANLGKIPRADSLAAVKALEARRDAKLTELRKNL
jgi:hypothetical protein